VASDVEALDRIARSGEAVFATDSADRIILWNRKCEKLLGRTARSVLGRRCDEVLGGRDVFGNVYCHRNCPSAFQARESREPVNRFTLSIAVPEAGTRDFQVSMFTIPSYHPALSPLVHVIREGSAESRLERQLAREAEVRDPLWPMSTDSGQPVVLTIREKEILQCLAEGLTVPLIAERLFLAPVTVRNHTSRILQKLEVHSKLAAVVYAYRNKLLAS
jgi:DNA-binding CsgD family transcriptional regulator